MSNAQVLIIGGGAMGVSLMYHLTKAGWSDVVLVEKNDLTHGSTWHAAGLCTHFAHNPTIQELRATSVRLYRDILPEETGQNCGFHRSGAMRITSNPDRMDEFRHVAGLSDFTGYPLEVLTPERIAELHPLAKLDGLLGGIYEPDDGHVDPTLATNAMAQVATRNGAKVSRYNAVQSIRREGDKWIVETAKETFRATHIVNAAGTWGWEIGHMMGLNIPSVPVLHQYLVTDAVPEVTERLDAKLPELPMIRDPEESWYVRQERDGLILGPYEKEAQAWSVDGVPPEFGADLMPPDLDRVEHIIEAAMERIPALMNGGVKTVVNGPITFTPDANPLIGPAHGLENAWLLTGSSMGVMEGGGSGWFLAHWMTHGAPPMDALAVDSRRFGSWADRDYRVEKAIECFGLQFGVHYPFEERPAGRGKRVSPLHDLMVERGAVMGAAYGWERPNWFSDKQGDIAHESFRRPNWFPHVAKEVETVTTKAGLADLSVFSKFDITGPEARAFIDGLGANRAPANGRIGLTHVLTPAGGVLSEFTVTMLSDTHAYLTSAAAAEEIDMDQLTAHAKGFDVAVSNRCDEMAVIGLMGPLSRDILSQHTSADLGDGFPWLSAQVIDVAGVQVRALRVSYLGELGWELHMDRTEAEQVFLALETSGKPLGMGYYGAYAANSMRLEKGYRGWGGDLTTERTLHEAGVGMFARAKDRTFTGRDAMLERRDSDDRWDMVLLEIHDPEFDPFYAHSVLQGDEIVGVVTSGAHGHRTGKTLALAYLRDRTARANLTVSILGRKTQATILSDAPFDPENLRLKA
ncbi:4-methylaminobutanoate oxidase (formaldehyde-forming) [Falsiruegeria litorea R37]|uniref:4-methylaminobutanoate oxidase (Formaldehyde-forming) n=1 Tax=Falsiruegeria litorea R37 TaxID=1200284 RepID=A0A1Y5SEI5_9RHOB|nr:FAD-dependent oxidoreductase [Falsiruegeria litorea]SLN35870.1 4-methylaminobutanoate oxidase (formaldehyde-forming) [Falsiruegeria litorea R37]